MLLIDGCRFFHCLRKNKIYFRVEYRIIQFRNYTENNINNSKEIILDRNMNKLEKVMKFALEECISRKTFYCVLRPMYQYKMLEVKY